MNDQNAQFDELEMYLDGMLSASDREVFLKKHDPDQLKQTLAIQNQIDDSLRSMFQFDLLDSVKSQQLTGKAFENDSSILSDSSVLSDDKSSSAVKLKESESNSAGRRFVITVLAASILGIIGGGMLLMNGDLPTDPEFKNRAVALLYQEKVQSGFIPYYHCEDPQRFKDTFEFRLGKKVQLAESEMPEGTRMLGLSYLGGTSDRSTAMLGEVDGNQVIVFVDRSSADLPDVSTEGTNGLNVFVVERDGLVFAEVSPLPESKMIQYFKVLDE